MPKRDRDESSGFTGKRNKSFREMDAQRGKSKYHSRHDDPQQQKLEKSASYQKYKSAVDSLFSGAGPVPDGAEKTFDPDGKKKAQREAMNKLREAADRKAWVQGVVDYLAAYPELPEDAFFLDSLLDHPKERIVFQALGKLESLQDEGKLGREKAPKSLEQRLKSLELTGGDPELQQRAKALRGKVS